MANLRGGGSNLTRDLVVFGESLGGHFSLEAKAQSSNLRVQLGNLEKVELYDLSL
jgi:hypothetical protein